MIYYIQLDYDDYLKSETYQQTKMYDSSKDAFVWDNDKCRHYNQIVQKVLNRLEYSEEDHVVLGVTTIFYLATIITTIWIQV